MAGPTDTWTIAPIRDNASLQVYPRITRKILFQGNPELPLHLNQARVAVRYPRLNEARTIKLELHHDAVTHRLNPAEIA